MFTDIAAARNREKGERDRLVKVCPSEQVCTAYYKSNLSCAFAGGQSPSQRNRIFEERDWHLEAQGLTRLRIFARCSGL